MNQDNNFNNYNSNSNDFGVAPNNQNNLPPEYIQNSKSADSLPPTSVTYSSSLGQSGSYLNSQNISNTTKPKPKKNFISSIFYSFQILFVVTILLVATFFAIILVAPKSEFSQLVVKNTLLKDFINIDSDTESQNSTDNLQNVTQVDNLTGGINKDDVSPFSFVSPVGAKTIVEVVDSVLPSVLSITVKEVQSSTSSLVAGTGYIVSDLGLVVTNKHVISSQCQFGSAVEIIATNQDNDLFSLKLLTIDPVYDIAILEIQNPSKNLVPVTFASSESVKLGTEVIAIGNALGQLQNTVTSGIVSGLARSVTTDLVDECTNSPVFADGLVQTDAAINQGNSGGPLFNASGQLIGMNTFGTVEAENIGLAIPSTAIVSALNSYRENGVITRPKLGIYSQNITPFLKDREIWLPVDYGELIVAPSGQTAVEKGSAADVAGLKEGDIILEINDIIIESTQGNPSPFRRALLKFKPGDTIKLKVLKKISQVNNSGFTYESQPVQISAVLGKVTFEL